MDIGNSSFKQALAFCFDVGPLKMIRVRFTGPYDNPNRPRASQSLYEMANAVGIGQDGDFTIRRVAVYLHVDFSLKIAVLWNASEDKKLVLEMPKGPEFLAVLYASLLTKEQVGDAIQEHPLFWWAQSNIIAERHKRYIQIVAINCSTYLGIRERTGCFDCRMDYIEDTVRQVWPYAQLEICNKGHGMAEYIFQNFLDPVASSN